jgi:hypothetical protein
MATVGADDQIGAKLLVPRPFRGPNTDNATVFADEVAHGDAGSKHETRELTCLVGDHFQQRRLRHVADPSPAERVRIRPEPKPSAMVEFDGIDGRVRDAIELFGQAHLAEGVDAATLQPFAAKRSGEIAMAFQHSDLDPAPSQQIGQCHSSWAGAGNNHVPVGCSLGHHGTDSSFGAHDFSCADRRRILIARLRFGVFSLKRERALFVTAAVLTEQEDAKSATPAWEIARRMQRLSSREKIADRGLITHRHVQIAARNAGVGVTCGIPDLSERSPTSQRVPDKRVATVVDCQRFEPGGAENAACGPEPFPKRVA